MNHVFPAGRMTHIENQVLFYAVLFTVYKIGVNNAAMLLSNLRASGVLLKRC